jgi:hypothetical protein
MCGERTRLGRIFHKNCEHLWIAERVRRSAESSENTNGVNLNQRIEAAYATALLWHFPSGRAGDSNSLLHR